MARPRAPETDPNQTPEERLAKALAENEALRQQLATSEEKRSEAEQNAIDLASAQGALLQSDVKEIPTGKQRKMQRCKGYKVVGHKDDGREILKPVFETVETPTFKYKIDIPPCGGEGIKLNGQDYYHGAVYEFDIDTLRSVKEIVARVWEHDKNIHGSDENAYRPKQSPRLSLRGGAA